jgi:hypothetical protein
VAAFRLPEMIGSALERFHACRAMERLAAEYQMGPERALLIHEDQINSQEVQILVSPLQGPA